jgi:hypothetical protein
MYSESVVEFDWAYLLTLDIRSIRNSRVQKGGEVIIPRYR